MLDDHPTSPRTDLVSPMPCICEELYKPRARWPHETWAQHVGLYGVHHPTCDGSAEGWIVVPPDIYRYPCVHANRPKAREALEAVLCALGFHASCATIELMGSWREGEHVVFTTSTHGDRWLVLSPERYRQKASPPWA
jgi:hypothetical protein